MYEDVNGNRKLFWKERSNAKEGKVEGCSRINDGNGMRAQGENEVRKIWKEYFGDLYNIDTSNRLQSTCVALMGSGEVTTSEESQLEELRVEVRVGKIKNGKAAGKDEMVTGW